MMRAGHARPERIKLLLADVDGTLVTKEKLLTDRAIAAVHRLHDAGIRFAITSGRPPKGMAMLIAPLALDTPIAGFNGGQFVSPTLDLIEARSLPREASAQAIGLLHENGLDVWVYAGEDWLVTRQDAPHVAREQWTVKFPPKIVADFTPALDHVIKIVGISDDAEKIIQVEKEMQKALGEHASVARSQPYYIDITHPQANKGGAIAYLSRALAIPESAIATIGDQPNDVLMFRRSGLAIAMGNAADDVKSQADDVTTSSEDEGFANAVERFVLPLA